MWNIKMYTLTWLFEPSVLCRRWSGLQYWRCCVLCAWLLGFWKKHCKIYKKNWQKIFQHTSKPYREIKPALHLYYACAVLVKKHNNERISLKQTFCWLFNVCRRSCRSSFHYIRLIFAGFICLLQAFTRWTLFHVY